MNSMVVYESKFGNTQKVAEVITRALGSLGLARVFEVEDRHALTLDAVELLVIGGPTQAHGMSPGMRVYLEALIPGAPAGVRVATFDTRLKGPGFLWGSAAKAIADQLRKAAFVVVAPPENFLVEGMREPRLLDGEELRAEAWAIEIGAQIATQVPAMV
jgi:flavodoxin